jgi:hypothetical protein
MPRLRLLPPTGLARSGKERSIPGTSPDNKFQYWICCWVLLVRGVPVALNEAERGMSNHGGRRLDS